MELFAADGHDAGGCERVTGKSGMRPFASGSRDWIFEDDGYSGATLERPGLERVRDLAAAGDIQVVLVHSPDRLSRKYAYQVLLIEEFGRHGVETRFRNAPSSATAEDQLLVQFQGMMAEYKRAQILERSRRGKRHRARAGEISVMSGAPYGYRYLRKRDDVPARTPSSRSKRGSYATSTSPTPSRAGASRRSAGGSTSKAWPRGKPEPTGGARR